MQRLMQMVGSPLNVEAGVYSVTASYIGYQSSTESNVTVKVDLTTPLNFSMQASAVEVKP